MAGEQVVAAESGAIKVHPGNRPQDSVTANTGKSAASRATTLLEIVRRRAQADPDRDGFVFLTFRQTETSEERRLSYGDLYRRAQAVAATLQVDGAKGDRVLILCPPGLDYVAAFFGCQLAGMVAVPAYPPRNAKHMGRLEAIMLDAGASAILVPAELRHRLAGWAGDAVDLPRLIPVDTISADAASHWVEPNVSPEDLAFLQYTSGTTGTPKGVMIRHSQLVDNVSHIAAVWSVDRSSTLVLWLPPYHDMGLIDGLVLPIATGAKSVLMSPASFLQRPLRWLDAIGHYQATHTIAPNFAYQQCVESISDEQIRGLDLRTLRSAALGAEPIRTGTLAAFAAKFSAAGFAYEQFATAYGLAETVVLSAAIQNACGPTAVSLEKRHLAANQIVVTARLDDRSSLEGQDTNDSGRPAVSCGPVIGDHDLRIVDPETRRECTSDRVGEVWISGPSVAAGYWGKSEATAEIFAARLAGQPDGRIYFRTGDLGSLIDGELYLLGRIKEMIIVRGRNHYAQDIEATAAGCDPILGGDRTIAFGIEEDGEERVVLVHELSRSAMRSLDAPTVFAAMRRAVVNAHEINLAAIVLVRPASLPRTTSGKLQHGICRDRFLAGGLAEVAEWRATGHSAASERSDGHRPPSSAEARLPEAPTVLMVRAVLADLMRLPIHEMRSDTALDQLGLDSLQVCRLTARLEDATGKGLPLQSVFEAQTIGDVANAVDRGATGDTMSVKVVDRTAPLPLSSAQERLLAIESANPGHGALKLVTMLRLSGPLDHSALGAALGTVIDRHEILRTLFVRDEVTGAFSPTIGPPGIFQLEIRHLSEHEASRIESVAQVEAEHPLDPFGGPILRAVLLACAEDEAVLIIGVHHVAIDAVSFEILWRELEHTYKAAGDGSTTTLTPVGRQYFDFADWEHASLAPARLAALTDFWRETLAGAPTFVNLPFDRPRPIALSSRTGTVRRRLPAEMVTAIQQLAVRSKVTPFIVLESTLATLCAQLAGSRDIVIGTASDGRKHAAFERTVGMFVNTIALRHALPAGAAAADVLEAARATLLSAREHDQLPFADLVAALNPARSSAFDPIFQVFFQLRPTPFGEATRLGDASVEAMPSQTESRAADLAVLFDQHGTEISGSFIYSADLFDNETIECLADLYLALLGQIIASPKEAIEKLWEKAISATSVAPHAAEHAATLERLVGRPHSATGAWYPLSSVQRGLWLQEQASPENAALCPVAMMELPPSIDRPRLVAAIRATVAQHQSLRLRFSADGQQNEDMESMPSLQHVLVPTLARPDDRAQVVMEWYRRPSAETRMQLTELAILDAPDGVVFVVRAPHLAQDGWAALQGFKSICKNYAILSRLPDHRFESEPAFLDSLKSDQLYRWSPAYEVDRKFWKKSLAEDRGTPLIHMLADRPESLAAPDVRSERWTVPAALCTRLSQTAEALSISTSGLLTGLAGLYLGRLTGQESLVLTVPFLNRSEDTLQTMGHFVNLLPVRLCVDPAASVRASLEAVAARLLTAYQYGRFPYDEIVRTSGLDHHHNEISVNTLLQRRGLMLKGEAIQMRWLAGPEWGLSFLFTQFGADAPLELELRYNAERFDNMTVARHGERLLGFIERACGELDAPLCDVPLMNAAERDLVVRAFNQPESVVDMFSEQAARAPANTAIIDGDRTITYGELDATAGELAQHLVELGVGSEDVVGVCLERSPELIISLLGIIKAGGAYLPLDPDYPLERLKSMITDTECVGVIADSEDSRIGSIDGLCRARQFDDARLPPEEYKLGAFFDDIGVFAPNRTSEANRRAVDQRTDASDSRIGRLDGPQRTVTRTSPEQIACVLFTSGSTGRPKGAMLTHGGLANYVKWRVQEGGGGPDLRVLLRTPVSFDVLTEEAFWPLCSGGSIVIPTVAARHDPAAIGDLLRRHEVSVFIAVPTLLKECLAAGAFDNTPALREVLYGGEVLDAGSIRHFCSAYPDKRLKNRYGPAETVVNATFEECRADHASSRPTIGKPIPNNRIYVVDGNLNPQPVEVAGELLIGGAQVARGYMGQPGLTAEKFIADPFSGEAGSRLYRTGDLARWRADGTLEYLGRADHQVKIRGMRVELGEIEAALQGCDDLVHAVGVARQQDSDTRLVAYVVPARVPDAVLAKGLGIEVADLTDDRRVDVAVIDLAGLVDLEAVRATLKQTLPEHMVPAGYVGLSRLPQTASGKIDRKALPEADISLQHAVYVAPRSETERIVVDTVAELLDIAGVGLNDNFFDLGGHSLLAVRLVARLEAATGRPVPVRAALQNPTLKNLAGLLEDASVDAYDPLLRLRNGAPQPSGKETVPTLFCIHGGSGFATFFDQLVEPLAGVAQVVGVQARGLVTGEAAFSTYAEMIDAYQTAIASETTGSVILLGWSLGGYVAHDLACRLEASGRPVDGVVLLDSPNQIAPGDRSADFDAWLRAFDPAAHPWIETAVKATEGGDALWRRLADSAVSSGTAGLADLSDDPALVDQVMRIWHLNALVLDQRPRSGFFAGPALVARASDTREENADPTMGWRDSCAVVDGMDVPFGHFDLMRSDAMAIIAGAVRDWMGRLATRTEPDAKDNIITARSATGELET